MPTPTLGFWGEFFMVQVLLTLPALGIAEFLRIRSGKPLAPKIVRYRKSLVGQFLFLLIIILAAREEHISLLTGPLPGLSAWLLALGFVTTSGLNARRAFPKLNAARLERARILLPEEPSQMPYWAAISAMAGVTEECAYRGLAFRFLTANHGSVALALALCIISFAIAHLVQSWRAVLGIALIAGVLHAVVFLTQTLILAIVVHAIYDFMVGVIAMPFLNYFASKTQPAATAEAT